MSKFDPMLLAASILLVSGAVLSAFAARPELAAIPNFSSFEFGWVKACTGFLPPVSDPGPMIRQSPIGLSDRSALDNYGTPRTTRLHVVERFKTVEGGKTPQASFTVDDPGASA